MSDETGNAACAVKVKNGSMWNPMEPCGRPIKRDGKCGIHAAADERRASGDRKRAEARDEARRITEALRSGGLNGYAYPGEAHHAGSIRVEMDAHELLAFIERRSPVTP